MEPAKEPEKNTAKSGPTLKGDAEIYIFESGFKGARSLNGTLDKLASFIRDEIDSKGMRETSVDELKEIFESAVKGEVHELIQDQEKALVVFVSKSLPFSLYTVTSEIKDIEGVSVYSFSRNGTAA